MGREAVWYGGSAAEFGDQLESFSPLVDLEMFRTDMAAALGGPSGSPGGSLSYRLARCAGVRSYM